MCRPVLTPTDEIAREVQPAAEVIPFNDRAAILAEADHRIANHLALLASYVRLKGAELDRAPEEPSRRSARLILDGVMAQIEAVARLHRTLVADSGSRCVDLAHQLHEVCLPFASGLSGSTEIIEELSADCVVSTDQLLPLAQIVAEVLTNAVKHAAETNGRAVIVRCRPESFGGVLIEVIDDGPGFPESFDSSDANGLGFHLVRGLSKQLGALATFQSTAHGVRFRLSLPGSAPAASASSKDAIREEEAGP